MCVQERFGWGKEQPEAMSAYVGSSKNLEDLTDLKAGGPLRYTESRPGAKMFSLQILSTEGRAVGLCWAKLKPQGPTGRPGAKT